MWVGSGVDDIAQGGRTEITPSLDAGVYMMSAILLKQSHLRFRLKTNDNLKPVAKRLVGFRKCSQSGRYRLC